MKTLEEHEEAELDYEEELTTTTWCCFPSSCFGSRRKTDIAHVNLLHQQKEGESASRETENWFVEKGKKLKEVSELVAGPKWKTFIRKFNYGSNRRRRNGEFQYDPYSYALNFDQDEEDDDELDARLRFSNQFADPVRGDSVPTQLNRS